MRLFFLILLFEISRAAAQPLAEPLQEPYGHEHALLSPDGAFALFGEQDARVAERNALWIEDRRTNERRVVIQATVQTLTVAWSPDSAAFIVNDRAVSDVENAYLFDAKTLARVDLTRLMSGSVGSNGARFLKPHNDHSYFHAIRWIDARHVEAQLYGHTVGIRSGSSIVSGDCFDLRFRISRDGAIEQRSQQVAPLGSNACVAMTQ